MEIVRYPSGPDLSAHFSKPQPQPDLPLPERFDDSCKSCGESMERVQTAYWTTQRPYATFLCQGCKLTLLIFEAPVSPLLVWSDSFLYATDFSDMIEERIRLREQKRERRALREGAHE